MPNWIELPVNPPNARKIQIHNLSAGTTYEFQVNMNEMSDFLVVPWLIVATVNVELRPLQPTRTALITRPMPMLIIYLDNQFTRNS